MSSCHREHVERCSWLTTGESSLGEAGCLTVAVGMEAGALADAYGLDLGDPVPADSERRRSGERLAMVAELPTGQSLVIEDMGSEGSRPVVVRRASRAGRAASVSWDVEGMALFSCARRRRVLYSEELDYPADDAELPLQLAPYSTLAESEDANLVAVGAAMVEAFTGVTLAPEVAAADTWYPILPRVERLPTLTTQTTPLHERHGELVSGIAALDAPRRRVLVHHLAHVLIRQASLLDEAEMAEVLASVTPVAPGIMTRRLEGAERRRAREEEALWLREDAAVNAGQGEAPVPEEQQAVNRRGWAYRALAYACHPDDLTAALGIVECARMVYVIDQRGEELAAHVRRVVAAPPEDWQAMLSELPAPPTAADRRRELERQRALLGADPFSDETAHSADDAGEGWAPAVLRHSRPTLVARIAALSPPRQRELAGWTACHVLWEAGLLDRPWLAAEVRALADGSPMATSADPSVRLDALFAHLDNDPGVIRTTVVDEEGVVCSRQHFALPVVTAAWEPDPLEAACVVLHHGLIASGTAAAALLDEVSTRFLSGGPS